MHEATGSDPHEIERVMNRVGLSPKRLLEHAGFGPNPLPPSIFPLVPESAEDVILHRQRRSLLRSPFDFLFRINLHTLDEKLRGALDAMGVGYSYMIRREGRLAATHSGGWAQRPDDGDLAWNYNVVSDTGSVGKFVTATAIMRLLDAAGLSELTAIGPYLPHYWPKGPGVERITFRDLLQHRSGLGLGTGAAALGDAGIAAIKAEIGTGVPPRKSKGVKRSRRAVNYRNVNYSLLRVLGAVVEGAVSPGLEIDVLGIPPFFPTQTDVLSSDLLWDVVTAYWYIGYVNDNVFGPAGLFPRDLKWPPDSAKAYDFASAGIGSWIPDHTPGAGAGCWHFSMDELCRLIGEIRRGGTIVSKSTADRMLSELYGLDSAEPARAGLVRVKRGRTQSGPNRCIDTGMFFLPGDVELAITFNAARPPAPGAVPPDPTPALDLRPIIRLIDESTGIHVI